MTGSKGKPSAALVIAAVSNINPNALRLKRCPPTITLSMVSMTANNTLGRVSKAMTAIQKPPAMESTSRLRYSVATGLRLRAAST